MRGSRKEPIVLPARRRSLELEALEERLLLSGAILYVDDNFTSGTPGWGIDHFNRIQSGINAAGPGDIVMVSEGTYYENIAINSWRSGLTLQGAGADVTVIDGGRSGSVVNLDDFDGGVISGFTIRNGSASEGGGINCDSSTSTITSCIITGNSAEANGGGVYVDGGWPTIVNNVVTGNFALFGGAFYMDDASPAFANNTIFGNAAGSCGGALYGTESVFTMANCILWENESSPLFPNDEIMLRSDADLTIRYSIIMDGDDEIYAWMGGDFSYDWTNSESDPMFVAAWAGDFHLRATSPAIDAANGDAAPATDFHGNPRIDDPLTPNRGVGSPDYADMGAFEFGSTPDNAPPTIASLQASPDPVTRPEDLTLTALGVEDPNGADTILTVRFYRDVNGNGTLEPNTDALLGDDTRGADGWSWTGSTGAWPTGSPHTYFARVQDSHAAWGDAAATTSTVLNAEPQIGFLAAYVSGDLLTLAANEVADPDGAVALVGFYCDDGDEAFEPAEDVRLGEDGDGSDGWIWSCSATGLPLDNHRYFARARDNDGAVSGAASTTGSIGEMVAVSQHEYADGVLVTIYDRDPSNDISRPDCAYYAPEFVPGVTDIYVDAGWIGDQAVNFIGEYGIGADTADLGFVIEGNARLGVFLDLRTGTPPDLGFLASEGHVGLGSV